MDREGPFKPFVLLISIEGMQGQPLQQNLVRRDERGALEALHFEEGRAVVLNIRGPYMLHRERLATIPLQEFVVLFKVPGTSSVPPHMQCSQMHLAHAHAPEFLWLFSTLGSLACRQALTCDLPQSTYHVC